MLTNAQKFHFVEEGYLHISGVVPKVLVDVARKAVNHSIGNVRPELPEGPLMVTGNAGDLVIAHHQIVHGACPNLSANIRYAVITRLKHKDCKQNGYAAYKDIWREWPGVTDIVETAIQA